MGIHAEISIIPIGMAQQTSMSKGVASAFEAISAVQGINATLTALGTQIEAESLTQIAEAIKVAHQAARSAGAERIISSVRIDERFDKAQTLQDKVDSVKNRLRH